MKVMNFCMVGQMMRRGSTFMVKKVKVKSSRNRPGVAQRVPGGLGSQIP